MEGCANNCSANTHDIESNKHKGSGLTICSDMAVNKIELTRKITDELNEEIGVPTICIYPNKRKKVTLTGSKFGGIPYWDNSQPYPTDKNGNKLQLLAQFNLNEISSVCDGGLGHLPNEGILQFFLLSGDDYLYGSDLDDYTNNNSFRVIYHPSIKADITEEDVLKLHIPTSITSANYYEPIGGEIALDFKVRKTSSPDYGKFKELFIKKAALYGWLIDGKGDYHLVNCVDSDASDELYGYAYNEDNCLLGYPIFVQYDPRTDDERYAKYDTQLLQLVSCDAEEGTDFRSVWGDMGVAHFFINHDKLMARDFSDIMYYWDCS